MAVLNNAPDAAATILVTMQALLELHRECARLGQEKKAYLMQGDFAKLEKTVAVEQALITEITRQEDHRMLAVRQLLGESATWHDDWSLTRVLRVVPPEVAHQLEDLRTQLVLVMEDLRTLNQANQRLTRLSLSYVDYMVNVISGAGADRSTNYSPLHQGMGDGAKESLLMDWKA